MSKRLKKIKGDKMDIQRELNRIGFSNSSEIQEYIIDKCRYITFTQTLAYKKALRDLKVNGIQPYSQFKLKKNTWLLEKTELVQWDGYNSKFQKRITTHDSENVITFLLESKEHFEKEALKKGQTAVDIKVYSEKLKDGINGSYFMIRCEYYKIKTKKQVERGIRTSIKNVIEIAYDEWFKNIRRLRFPDEYKPASRILPTKLMDSFFNKEITFDEFMNKLYDARLKKRKK
jgi:hypothetical protein